MSQSGIIFDIKKYAIHDGPGIRTTIFFKGCSMGCQWCHNPESKKIGVEEFTIKDRVKKLTKTETIGYEITVIDLMKIIKKDKAFYDESEGGVTISGGEPTIQIKFLKELLKECKRSSIHTVVDTCGESKWESFVEINDYVDLYLYDLKIFNNDLHKKYTGISNYRIHANLKKLIKNRKEIELRIPLIPDITDTDLNIENLINFTKTLKSTPSVTLLPYNPLNQDKLDRFCMKNKLGKLKMQNEKQLFQIKQKFIVSGIDTIIGE
jgi:pyruvate formate lyase activating enzyme